MLGHWNTKMNKSRILPFRSSAYYRGGRQDAQQSLYSMANLHYEYAQDAPRLEREITTSAWKGWERLSRERCFKDMQYDPSGKFEPRGEGRGWNGGKD